MYKLERKSIDLTVSLVVSPFSLTHSVVGKGFARGISYSTPEQSARNGEDHHDHSKYCNNLINRAYSFALMVRTLKLPIQFLLAVPNPFESTKSCVKVTKVPVPSFGCEGNASEQASRVEWSQFKPALDLNRVTEIWSASTFSAHSVLQMCEFQKQYMHCWTVDRQSSYVVYLVGAKEEWSIVSERTVEQASRGRMITCKSALDLNMLQNSDLHPHLLQLQFCKCIKFQKQCLHCLMRGRAAILSGYMYSSWPTPGFRTGALVSWLTLTQYTQKLGQ